MNTIQRLARQDFRPGRRQPCSICGQHSAIAHAHHVKPVGEQMAARGIAIDHDFVWLCPNHHAAIHLLIAQASSKRERASRAVVDLLAASSLEEIRALMDLLARSAE